MIQKAQKFFHELFEVSILFKGVHGFIEICIGSLLLWDRSLVSDFLLYLTRGELIEDPTDRVASYIAHLSNTISENTVLFIGIYFLFFGSIKILLVGGLQRHKHWAYTTSMVLITAFVVYQIYRFTHTHSFILAFLIVFDSFTIWLIWNEYKNLKMAQVREQLPPQ